MGLANAHLRSGGRRRIAFVNGPIDTAPGRARDQGFRMASDGDAAGPMVEVDDFTVAAGEQAWDRLRAAEGSFDAVLAANDLLALGVMRGALNDGVAIPGQVAVTGIDDIAFARIFAPALTSVSLGALRARSAGRPTAARPDGLARFETLNGPNTPPTACAPTRPGSGKQ